MVWCHYLSQMYMKGFGINEKQTIRFDKKNRTTLVAPIRSFCAQEDFFCFDDDELQNLPAPLLQFTVPNGIKIPSHLRNINKKWPEDSLAYYIEGPVTGILKKIRNEKKLENVSEEDLMALLGWACWLFVANPNSLAVEAIINTIGGDSKPFAQIQKASKGERLSLFFSLRDQIFSYFLERKWLLQLIDYEHGPLLTNDRPVMLSGATLTEKSHLINNTIFFPLSPDLILIGLKNSEWGYSHSPCASTEGAGILVTTLVYDHADRYVFGTDMQALEKLLKASTFQV